MNNTKNFEEFNEAIGFKVKGDNRDDDHSGYSKLGFNSSQSEITDRLYSVIDKLHALAERGVGGEKETAKRKLQEIGKKYGINTSTKVRGSTKLGFKFSWEDEEFIDEVDNETERKLLNEKIHVSDKSIDNDTINDISKFLKSIIRKTLDCTIIKVRIVFNTTNDDSGYSVMGFGSNQTIKLPEKFNDISITFDLKIKDKGGLIHSFNQMKKRIEYLNDLTKELELLKQRGLSVFNLNLSASSPIGNCITLSLNYRLKDFVEKRNKTFKSINR